MWSIEFAPHKEKKKGPVLGPLSFYVLNSNMLSVRRQILDEFALFPPGYIRLTSVTQQHVVGG
jgi:hypothetical protein